MSSVLKKTDKLNLSLSNTYTESYEINEPKNASGIFCLVCVKDLVYHPNELLSNIWGCVFSLNPFLFRGF